MGAEISEMGGLYPLPKSSGQELGATDLEGLCLWGCWYLGAGLAWS